MTITKTSSGNYMIVMDAGEAVVADRAEQLYGADVLYQLITNWVADRQSVLNIADAIALKSAMDKLPPAAKAKVKGELGL